ncbi:restriction endonuclease [Trichloromonas sp.]|uniref:restriction endonuclease n=1 Tax=Trichloromonas sp. TaxID=3069249 RepID=UPI002A4302AC|nr:restriction endonuclease [Trichloromonas sp.]
MGPILDALRYLGGSGKPREVSELVAERLSVPDKKQEETLKSGQSRFHNQVAWARQYLVWEGLLDSSTRGVWSLTEKGNETKLSDEAGRQIFLKWVKIHSDARKKGTDPDIPAAIEQSVDDDDHKQVLLEVLKGLTPEGFERVCARLLRESGFEKVTVTGGPKDEGIDGIGILQVNPFVSFKVLFQCKRYKGAVSRAQVGDFRNAMIGRADKGIIMTTGTFTTDARREADRDGAPPVELVDGEKLVEMFESIELGLKPKRIYQVDHAFFAPYLAKND